MPAFVKYNNSLNIKTWITNFERKSDSYGLDHGWKVLHLSDYLQDEALTYYFESLCNIEDWGKLKESLIIRFQKVKLTPLVEMMRITQEEQETVTQYFHRKMQLINNVELNLTSIVELLNEGVKTKYKPYLATVDAVQPSEWLTMAIKVENSLTGSGTPVEKGRLQTLNPALHPSPRPAGYYGSSQVQRPPMPCRICERLGLELQWHYHSVCPYRNPTASRSFPPPTPRVQRPTASRSFPSATPHSYQAAASSSFPPPTPHDYQPTVASASSPDSPRSIKLDTPMEKWKGRKPSIRHFRIFGCLAFWPITQQHRSKFMPKSRKGIFVGYSLKRKAYRVYDIITKKIEEVRSVKFVENEKGIDYAKNLQEDTNYDHFAYKKEEENNNEIDLRTRPETSELNEETIPTLDEPNEERIVRSGRKKGDTQKVLEEKHRAKLREEELKLLEQGVRRSQRIKERNNVNFILEPEESIPENYEEAINCENKYEWLEAMKEELYSIDKHKVWTLVQREKNMKIINCKWIFSIKSTPVIRKESLRAIVALAAQLNLVITSYDVKTAYLYGELKETIFMKQPEGFVEKDVLLPTLRVTLKGNRTEKTARAIIDTGSQRSYILHSTAMEMEYEQSRREFFRHSLFGGSSTDVVELEVYTIHLSDINNSYRCEFEALGQPLICGSIPPVCPSSFLEGSEELDVSDLMRDRIEVLIGADVAGRLLTDAQRRISSGLVAIRTKLGWTVMGKIPPTEVRDDTSSLCVTTLLSLDLENLWKLDAVGVSDAEVEKKTQSLQAEMEEHFAHTMTRDIEGRYEVALPWVQDKERIPSNRDLAENQLSSVRRKLEEVGDMNEYGQIFEECINQGIIEYSR
ncbi:hypothetical protein LAZ67_X001761 [Cordylochernes scorpioides]|uniref:Reverse transcriptase Ty1/copia-type domain-containing protein n=1 Tax=Cordylochernes scorpioides TaxID=51811 RepID=A0ABY6LUV1_9ARAC|nr:hypothetical protein LAZ67_X001761 [Cordylochernes scorpioides]